MDYEKFMKRALELAFMGTGNTSPNPRVGAVIIDPQGNIVGEGFHKSFGDPHAEVEAIKSSKLKNFEGYTLVVSLEPCNHSGKTPPCTEAIINGKFSRVVIGTLDENPDVVGSGATRLQEAGVEVITGVLEQECKNINKYYFKYIKTKKPFILMKIAQSLDGNIALKNGQSKWISGEESRLFVQKLRCEVDAVLVGKNTILIDNPKLNVRDYDFPSPKKVILDPELSLPLDLNIFKDSDRGKTIIFCHKKYAKTRKANTLALAGIKIEPIADDDSGLLNLDTIIKVLSTKYQMTSLLIEGGSQIFSSFIEHGLVDELHLFIAPKILGAGMQSFENISLASITKSYEIDIETLEKIGQDIYIVGKLKNK